MASRVVSVSSPGAGREVCRPPVAPAWFHAHGQVWVPFSEADNDALEEGWTQCRPALEERAAQTDEVASAPEEDAVGWLPSLLWYSKPATHASVLPPPPPPPAPNLRKTPLIHRKLDPDEDEDRKQFRVSVLEDRLFEVDLEKMIIFPALWPGYDQNVLRATWFYVASDGACSPIAWGSALSLDLDRVYEEAKPWNLVGRLRASLNVGKAKSDSDAPQLFDLPSVAGGAKVLFDSTSSARVYTYVCLLTQTKSQQQAPLLSVGAAGGAWLRECQGRERAYAGELGEQCDCHGLVPPQRRVAQHPVGQ